MIKKYTALFLLIAFSINAGYAQDRDSKRFTGYLSAGPNYYFNNIKTFHDNVKPVNYSFFARMMWQSGYDISLGIETGYNKFYRVSGFTNDESGKITLAAIPLHLVVGMKLKKHFYSALSFGSTILINAASDETGIIRSTVFSFADGSLAFGYKKEIGQHFNLGAEIKLNFSTKSADLNLAVPIVLSYNF